MSDFADYLEAAIIDWFQGTDMPAAPSSVYVALHTGAPGDDAASNELDDSAGINYSRQEVLVSDINEVSANKFENGVKVLFGPASGDWGDVSYFSLWDAQSGGNSLIVADVNTTRTVLDGDEAKFQAGELTFEVN
jgi:hypothetical protein